MKNKTKQGLFSVLQPYLMWNCLLCSLKLNMKSLQLLTALGNSISITTALHMYLRKYLAVDKCMTHSFLQQQMTQHNYNTNDKVMKITTTTKSFCEQDPVTLL